MIHIGSGITVPVTSVLIVLDCEKVSVCSDTLEFLQKIALPANTRDKKTKSVIVYEGEEGLCIYYSLISSFTIFNRSQQNGEIYG